MLEQSINASAEGNGSVHNYHKQSIFSDDDWQTLLKASIEATNSLSEEERRIMDTLNTREKEEEERLCRPLNLKELVEIEKRVSGSEKVVAKAREIFYQILGTNKPGAQ